MATKRKTTAMITDLKTLITHSGSTLVQDMAGATAIVVLLAVALHFPGVS